MLKLKELTPLLNCRRLLKAVSCHHRSFSFVFLLSSLQLSVFVWSEVQNTCTSMISARLAWLAYNTKPGKKQRHNTIEELTTSVRRHNTTLIVLACCGPNCTPNKMHAGTRKLIILQHGTKRCRTLTSNRCVKTKKKTQRETKKKRAPNDVLTPSMKTVVETDHERNRDRTEIRGNAAPPNCLHSHK